MLSAVAIVATETDFSGNKLTIVANENLFSAVTCFLKVIGYTFRRKFSAMVALQSKMFCSGLSHIMFQTKIRFPLIWYINSYIHTNILASYIYALFINPTCIVWLPFRRFIYKVHHEWIHVVCTMTTVELHKVDDAHRRPIEDGVAVGNVLDLNACTLHCRQGLGLCITWKFLSVQGIN